MLTNAFFPRGILFIKREWLMGFLWNFPEWVTALPRVDLRKNFLEVPCQYIKNKMAACIFFYFYFLIRIFRTLNCRLVAGFKVKNKTMHLREKDDSPDIRKLQTKMITLLKLLYYFYLPSQYHWSVGTKWGISGVLWPFEWWPHVWPSLWWTPGENFAKILQTVFRTA